MAGAAPVLGCNRCTQRHAVVWSAQTALFEQLFDVSQRQGVSQVPADGAENKDGFGLPPFEDH